MFVSDWNARSFVIENRRALFDARSNLPLHKLESRCTAGDVELNLAAWRYAEASRALGS
jgi:hypothetical protein